MTAACHAPDDEGNYTDEQFIQHLLTSNCSECVNAGFRFKELLKENQELRAQLEK